MNNSKYKKNKTYFETIHNNIIIVWFRGCSAIKSNECKAVKSIYIQLSTQQCYIIAFIPNKTKKFNYISESVLNNNSFS